MDDRLYYALIAAMVAANIFVVAWETRARPGRAKRWLVRSAVMAVVFCVGGGLLFGDYLAFGVIGLMFLPIAVGLQELGNWHDASLQRKAALERAREDSTLSPFLKSRSKKR